MYIASYFLTVCWTIENPLLKLVLSSSLLVNTAAFHSLITYRSCLWLAPRALQKSQTISYANINQLTMWNIHYPCHVYTKYHKKTLFRLGRFSSKPHRRLFIMTILISKAKYSSKVTRISQILFRAWRVFIVGLLSGNGWH